MRHVRNATILRSTDDAHARLRYRGSVVSLFGNQCKRNNDQHHRSEQLRRRILCAHLLLLQRRCWSGQLPSMYRSGELTIESMDGWHSHELGICTGLVDNILYPILHQSDSFELGEMSSPVWMATY